MDILLAIPGFYRGGGRRCLNGAPHRDLPPCNMKAFSAFSLFASFRLGDEIENLRRHLNQVS
jgi:hypothetical protein